MKHPYENLKSDLHKIYLENNIDERDFYDKTILSLIDKLPTDELIKGIVVKYDKKNEGIKLIWNINKLVFSNVNINYQIAKNNISWCVQYSCDLGSERFTEKKNDGLTFIESFCRCLYGIHEIYDHFCSKLKTKKELYDRLISVVDFHIGTSVWDEKYEANRMCLGIDIENFRPIVDVKENLINHDVYELDEYIKCFDVDLQDRSWELVNDLPFWNLVERYMKEDEINENEKEEIDENVTEDELKEFLKKKQMLKLTKTEFCEQFYEIMSKYLSELNSLMNITKITKPYLYSKLIGKKYFGVDIYSRKPLIGVVEGLDGCDIYDLEVFEKAFKVDETGKFVFKQIVKNCVICGFVLEDKTILNDLISRYFDTNTNTNTNTNNESLLSLVKSAKENIIDSKSNFVKLYKKNYWDFLDNRSGYWGTILGKYSDTEYCDDYVYLSKTIYNYIQKNKFEIREIDATIAQGEKYYRKATKLKKEKEYEKAIKWYLKCVELNVGFVVYDDLLVCYRQLKDFDNERLVAIEAYERFPHLKKYQKAYFRVLEKMSLK